MGRVVDVDDLVDAQGVAKLLGLTHRTSVATYLRRYPTMPRPVVEIPESRTRLWLASEVRAWDKDTEFRVLQEPEEPSQAYHDEVEEEPGATSPEGISEPETSATTAPPEVPWRTRHNRLNPPGARPSPRRSPPRRGN